MDYQTKRSNSGMSLLEVVLAVGLMGIVMAVSFSTLKALAVSRSNVKDMALYQKYLNAINDRVIEAFKQTYTDVDGNFVLPVNESEMGDWKDVLDPTIGGTDVIQDMNIGFRITRYVYNAGLPPPRMNCSGGTNVVWNSNVAGTGCPSNMLSGSNISNGRYEFCVKVDPINPALFPSQDDLLRQSPVVKYFIQVKRATNLTPIDLSDAASVTGIRIALVTYIVNWHNDEVDYSTRCKSTRGMYYTEMHEKR